MNEKNKKFILWTCVIVFVLIVGGFVGFEIASKYTEKTLEIGNIENAVKATSIANPSNKQVEIQVPNQKIKYEMLDSHLHYLDFLQTSDGFGALTKAMDVSGVKDAIVFGMPMAKHIISVVYNLHY